MDGRPKRVACAASSTSIESHGVRRRSANSPGLSPQFRGKAKRVIGQGDVAVWGGTHESVQPSNANGLVRPQKLALDLVIDDCRYRNASASMKALSEPVRDPDNFTTALAALSNRAVLNRGKERRSRVDERFT